MDQTQQRTPLGSHGGSVHEQADIADQIRIEDLPLDKKLEYLRKYNAYMFYDENRYIDAQDSINAWCLSQIMSSDKKNVNVHFDGWSTKWDVWQKINSFKIAPFRKYSRGYTGQNKVALRQNMKFNLDDLHIQKQRVVSLIEADLNGLGAFETTQYLRGTLYIYVDFLLQNGQYNEEYIDAINDFLYNVLRLIITWIKKLNKLIPLVRFENQPTIQYSQIKVNSDLFLIDENIAIMMSAYELMDILKKIFCCCHRCSRYYFLNDKNPIDFSKKITIDINKDFEHARKRDEEEVDIDEVKEMIMLRRGLVFGQFMNFINYFNEFGGFDAIIDFLKLGNESEDKIPLDMITLMTMPFRNCNQIFSEEFSSHFVGQIRDILCQRLNNMGDKEIKEIDKEIVGRVLIELRDILTLSLPDSKASEITEHSLLIVSLKFLKSSYLEKRLKGISDIKHMIERVEYAQKLQESRNTMQIDQRGARTLIDEGTNKFLKPPKWVDAQILKDWIIKERILEIVLGENTHLEIVKRSSCILKFLAKESSLPHETVDLVWKCQLGKHEEMVRVVYHMIQELVPHVDIKYIELLYQRIQQVPTAQYDDKYIDFLKNFTMKSLDNYYEMKQNEGSLSESQALSYVDQIGDRENQLISSLQDCINSPQATLNQIDDKQFGLPIFWDLIQDKAPQVTTEIMNQAINALNEILKENYCYPIRVIYLVKSVENLLKGESLAQSLIVCQNIISQYNEYDLRDHSVTSSKLIEQLNKQLQIVDKIIHNISIYQGMVKERLNAYQAQKKQIPEDFTNFVFVGKHPHEQTLTLLLQFLEFLIEKSDHRVSIGNHNIDTLWRNFVQSPNIQTEQGLFLKWINKTRESDGYEKHEISLFTEEERKYFFTKILCNPIYINSKISYGQVRCFQKYFKLINQQEQNIGLNRKKIKVLKYDDIIGLNALWSISIGNENERAREESMDLYVDIHLQLDNTIPLDQQQQIQIAFINQQMNLQDQNNDFIVANTIHLISRFLDRYEGKRVFKNDQKVSQYQMQPQSIQVLNKSDNTRKTISASYFQPIGVLRQKVADAFDYHINEFHMLIKNSYIDPDEEDDKPMKELGLIQNIIIQKNINYKPELHPKFLISNNQVYYDKLFQILTRDNPILVEPTWELLQKLPVNNKLQQDIKELSGLSPGSPGWDKLLDPKSTNKLYYSLEIINKLQQNKKDPKIQQWRYKFLQLGGFIHLLKTFLSVEIKQIDSVLTMKCIEQLIVTLYEFYMQDNDLQKVVIDQKEGVVLQAIRMIDLIVDYTIRVEKKRGESYEDLNRRVLASKLKKNKYKSYMPGPKTGQQEQKKNDDEDDQESQEFQQVTELNKQFSIDNQTVTNLFKFMMYTIFSKDINSVNLVAKYPNLEELLLKATIQTENWYVRVEMVKKIREILNLKQQTSDLGPLIQVVEVLYLKIQKTADHYESRTHQFFTGVADILDGLGLNEIDKLKPQFEGLVFEISNFILQRETKEKNTSDSDLLLSGRMKLLKSLLQKMPKLKDRVGGLLTDHLLHNCLFEVPQGGTTKSATKAGPPKCKSQNSRKQASNLLAILCRDSPYNLARVLEYMKQFNANPSWRTNKETDWNISLMDSEKSTTGYVGIKNLGCICYMNSLFQQLFMISSFRNDLLSVKETSASNPDKDEDMLYQLQVLFAGLLKSEKQYVNPKGFCHAFKDWEGQPTNVLEQMDVEEFFNMLMDRIETAIKGSPQQNTIQHHFGGKFASEMICKGCPHKYERSEPFLSISIPVKNKKSIIEGLTAFIQGDMLEGDNQYLCEKCDKKVDALKRTCVKRLPRHLIIAMRRFEFDYDKMIRVKVNDYCEFPMELSMEQFTQEGLARKERMQKMKEERGEDAGNEEETNIPEEPLKYPKEYYEYTLSGIVVHSGTADSGHYYSFIKDREHPESGKWYELNDHIVRDFDPNDIPSECFGGEDTFVGYNMVQMKTMKWRNAYLLIYERKNLNDIVHSDEELDKTSSFKQEDVEMKNQSASQELTILSEIEEKIAYENQKYWQNRFLFSNEYQEFVYDVSLYWNTSNLLSKTTLTKNNDAHIVGFEIPQEYYFDNSILDPLDVKLPLDIQTVAKFEEEVFKLAAGFYITVLQRSQNKTYVPAMLNLLKAYINKNANCASWIITQFSNIKILEENLLQCQQKEMRKFVAGLIYCSMLKLYPIEKQHLLTYWANPEDPNNNVTKIGNFSLILIHNIFYLKKFTQNWAQYFQLIARFASLGPEAREFLLRAKGVGRLMEFYYDQFSPHKEFFRDYSDVLPIYNERPELGLPTEIDKKQINHLQEMIERRRLKNIMDATPKYKYLIEAVSLLIRSYKNIERSPLQTDDIPFEGIIQQEKDLFIPDFNFLKQLFDHTRKNRSIKAAALGYCHYVWADKDGFKEVYNTIQLGLTKNDWDDIRQYLYLLQTMLEYPGGDQGQNRFEALMQMFIDTIKLNVQFYKYMEVVIEFILKISGKIPAVKEWFKNKKAQWLWIKEWSEAKYYPTNMMDSTLRLYKNRTIQTNQQNLKAEYQRNILVREVRNKRLEQLALGIQTDTSNDPDLDIIDLQDYKFSRGEQIELYYRRNDRVNFVTVETVLDELINVRYPQQANDGYQQNNQTQWMSTDSDKIYLRETYHSLTRVSFKQQHIKVKLYEILQQNYEKQRREQAALQGANQMRQGNPNEMEYDQDNAGGNYGGSSHNQYSEDEDDDSEQEYQNQNR